MKDAEGINISVVTMGNSQVDGRQPCNLSPMNLAKLYEFIDARVRDAKVRQEVRRLASSYPQGSLAIFAHNLRVYIEKAQKTVSLTPIQHTEELGDEKQVGKKEFDRAESFRELNDEFN